MGDNYEALCNHRGPCKAERSLMSWYVTLELQGCTANQPPRRGMKRTLTQVLHHHAGRNAITRPFLCAVIFTSPHQCWLLNQHARLPGKHCMESEVACGCNQKLSHMHCDSKFDRTLSRWEQHTDYGIPNGRAWKLLQKSGFLIPFSQKHRSTAWCRLLPFVTSMRVVPGVANANRLHLEPQGLRLGENIDDKLFSSVWTSASQTSNPFTAPADCPLDSWRTRQRGGKA